jgi:hypothetical protein
MLLHILEGECRVDGFFVKRPVMWWKLYTRYD